jgi:hypothetical protein
MYYETVSFTGLGANGSGVAHKSTVGKRRPCACSRRAAVGPASALDLRLSFHRHTDLA